MDNSQAILDIKYTTAREIYALSNAGEISITDSRWECALVAAIAKNDIQLIEAILCCGIPMTHPILNIISPEQKEVAALCKKFYPDIWMAVRTGNVKQVRCLVNLWHKVSLTRNGRTLFHFAVDNANPYIISLIGGIEATMDIAHFVLAGDLERLRAVRSNGRYIKRTLKHFGHSCAPILYFAIVQNDFQLVEELCLYFCSKGDDEMLDQYGEDIPLLFVALQNAVDTSIVNILASHMNRHLSNVWYQSKNILQFSIDLHVPVECFTQILLLGGGKLLAERDVFNRSVIDYVKSQEICPKLAELYRTAVDNVAEVWMRNKTVDIGWLAGKGFDFSAITSDQSKYGEVLVSVHLIQQTISSMSFCIDTGNFQQFCYLESLPIPTEEVWPDVVWYGCPIGTGQTLLHRAVVKNRADFVDLFLNHANVADIPLDNFGASALSYACADSECGEIERKLLCSGFGEYSMDKTGHDCASYRMKRDTPEMKVFLSELSTGYYGASLLSLPWTTDSGAIIQNGNNMRDWGSVPTDAGNNEIHGLDDAHDRTTLYPRRSVSESVGSQKNSWCIIM
ncbi:uncharacterized protein LOC129583772 [Paramacrobiotus metropolitanus]|uniref:uncharacterized protein LOC129583772 n=1 Tax=Paramacrobiotus metropolitanus TaxID=2943436 RepID=UPI0024460705|nr:uncharacterized protein LOC129583772 [Paramacrobiotus metropolitanus]